MKLLEVVEQLLNYRFYASITPAVITYIANTYTTSGEKERELMATAWGNILRIPEKISDENLYSKFKLACLESLQLLKKGTTDFQNRIVHIFYISTLYYNDYRICCYFQNGKMYYKFMQIDGKQTLESFETPDEINP